MNINDLVFLSSTSSLAHFVLYALLGTSIFLIALLGTYAKFRWRLPLVGVFFACFMAISYVSLGQLLGNPKPVDIMLWDRPNVEKARVMGQFFKRDEGIYLLLIHEGITVPRYYQFPWNEQMAKELKQGEEGRKGKENQGVELLWPFQPSHEEREFPEVHEIPWPAPPAKDQQQIEQINLDSIDV